MINTALDTSLVSCGWSSWDLFFSIASDAAQLAGICTPAGSNKFYRDGIADFYDDNIYDDPEGILSGEHDDPANCFSHYVDYPQIHGVGLNDSLPNIQGVWSNTAAGAGTLPSTGADTATWSGVSNALMESEQWASIQPATSTNGRVTPFAGTQYIVLTGYQLSVPADATIVGIAAAIKGYSYYTADINGPFGAHYFEYRPSPICGVFNAGLMLNSVFYPFADPSATFSFTGPPAHGHAPWPNDPGIRYIGGTPRSTGMYPQLYGGYPVVVDPSWYPRITNPPTETLDPLDVPSQSMVAIKPLVTANRSNASEGPLFCGNLVGCPTVLSVAGGQYNVQVHNGPVQKNFNLTPTKQVWTPAEVTDPSFGVALSVWAGLANDVGIDHSFFYQAYMFLNCIGLGVYYVPGEVGGEEAALSMRPRVWIST